jgi:hypothetical protein
MRGCVSAGMITAVWHLGLQDSVDVVYVSQLMIFALFFRPVI